MSTILQPGTTTARLTFHLSDSSSHLHKHNQVHNLSQSQASILALATPLLLSSLLIMSGMELLLQAAGCSDGASSTESVCSSSTSRSSYSDYLSPSRSNNMSSLPPKKRMKVNFVHNAVSSESSFQLPRSGSVVSSGMSATSTTSSHGSSSSSFYTDSPMLNSDWTTITTATQGPQANTFIHSG